MSEADDPLNLLLDDLESRAQQRAGDRLQNQWVCQRRFPRSPFRANCNVYYFVRGSLSIASLIGRTRNLSRNGVGLLVRRVFRAGEPMEVEITLPDYPKMHMAGLVTFCRYAGQGFHEVGVDLKTAGSSPIFCKDPLGAIEANAWLQIDFVRV